MRINPNGDYTRRNLAGRSLRLLALMVAWASACPLRAGTPDLAPIAFSGLGGTSVTTNAPNPTLLVSWTVINQGTGPATNGWYDRVMYSTNGVLDAQSVYLGQVYYNQGLAPGASYTATNQVILPMAGSGSFWLFLQVDPYNYVVESDKANNVSAPLAGAFTLRSPDLAPQALALAGGAAIISNAPNPTLRQQGKECRQDSKSGKEVDEHSCPRDEPQF